MGLAALLAALFLLAACQAPPAQFTDPVKVEVVNADAFAPLAGNFGTRSVERGGLLCATESGNCVESWNGSDVVLYSDAGSTTTFAVDGATGNLVSAGTVTVDNVIVQSVTFTATAPITLSGVLTNVQLLYYQVP